MAYDPVAQQADRQIVKIIGYGEDPPDRDNDPLRLLERAWKAQHPWLGCVGGGLSDLLNQWIFPVVTRLAIWSMNVELIEKMFGVCFLAIFLSAMSIILPISDKVVHIPLVIPCLLACLTSLLFTGFMLMVVVFTFVATLAILSIRLYRWTFSWEDIKNGFV